MGESDNVGKGNAIRSGINTTVRQTFASLIIPPLLVNRVVAGTRFLLQRYTIIRGTQLRWLSVGTGLFVIPLLSLPVDQIVGNAMISIWLPLANNYLYPRAWVHPQGPQQHPTEH